MGTCSYARHNTAHMRMPHAHYRLRAMLWREKFKTVVKCLCVLVEKRQTQQIENDLRLQWQPMHKLLCELSNKKPWMHCVAAKEMRLAPTLEHLTPWSWRIVKLSCFTSAHVVRLLIGLMPCFLSSIRFYEEIVSQQQKGSALTHR